MGSLRVGHNWATSLSLLTFMHWRRKWQPTPVFLPGKSHGWRSLVGYCLWGRTESDTTEANQQQQQQVRESKSGFVQYLPSLAYLMWPEWYGNGKIEMAMCNVQADSPRTTSRDSVLSSVSGENSRMFSHMAVVSHQWTSLHRKKPESMELQGSRIGAHPSHVFLAVKEDTISH